MRHLLATCFATLPSVILSATSPGVSAAEGPGSEQARSVTIYVSKLGNDSDGSTWTTASATIQPARRHLFRFEKVTFNNNICEHLNAEPQDQEDTATVRLWGRNLIAMGNHIKADDNFNAMSLGNRQVALMGNITTGGFIRVGAVTPAPLTDFNIRT